MNPPLLSICIPTYKRSQYLREALDSIKVQFDSMPELNNLVEVVVADNASPDDTEFVTKSFLSTFQNFVYIKNAENVGFDGNVNIVVRGAHGDYCWYLGDDDAIENGAIKHMIDICRDHKYSVISMTDRPLLQRPLSSNEQVDYSETDHIDGLSPSEAYIKGHLPSALSMLAFRRKDWLDNADFNDHTPGWFYFETILKMAAVHQTKILHITRPMVLTGQDMRWADGGAGLKIFIDCNRFLYKMIDDWGYDKTSIEAEMKGNIRKFPYVLLQSKAKGLPISLKNVSMIQNFTNRADLKTKLLSNIIFFIPNPIVRFMRDLKKKLK